MIINKIEYDISKMNNLNYVLEKANEYVDKVGWTRATKSQKFIRHIQIFIALKLKDFDIPDNDIRFETKLIGKNVDLCIFKDNIPFLAISLKSQSSSIIKNFTNTANALQGETTNLKSIYPNLKTCSFILYKKNDAELQEDCTKYYKENIPTKILPLISSHFISSNKFDFGCIVLWEITDKIIEIEQDEPIFKEFGIDNFFQKIKELYENKNVKSQFTLKEFEHNLESFLNDDKI